MTLSGPGISLLLGGKVNNPLFYLRQNSLTYVVFSNGLSCLQVIAFIYYSYVKPVAHREIQESQYLTPGKRATAVCVYEDLFLPPQRCSAPLS